MHERHMVSEAFPSGGRSSFASVDTAETPKRILFHMLGGARKASSRVRGYWIADELRKRGHAVEMLSAATRRDYLRLLRRGLGQDAVIFQKRYSRYDVVIARILRLAGVQVLFDLDDAPSRDRNPATERNAAAMMRQAHHVLVGSQNLQALAHEAVGHAETVHLIASGIQLENYETLALAPKYSEPVCLGWIGNGGHYANDLISILRPVLEELAPRHNLKLRIVGAAGRTDLHEAFGSIEGIEAVLIDQIDWSDPKAVARELSAFDIGLYPLIETPFNRYKCAFKALEYMASNIPVVASDVGANGDVIRDGTTGFLVHDTEHWVEKLHLLIADPSRRAEMGAQGRAQVEADYSTTALARKIEALL